VERVILALLEEGDTILVEKGRSSLEHSQKKSLLELVPG
jgi:hypothetical protein